MKRSKFNHSHVNNTTCKMGFIVPTMLTECLPGDTWQGDSQFFIRLAPLVAPVMHRTKVMACTFFVPNRLTCPKFAETFITGGPDGEDDTVLPFVRIRPTVGSLADYFGLPLLESGEIEVSALPFRAYNLIYNEFFRDQDLQEPLPVSIEPGEDTTTVLDLQRANWEKDYFTTARPEPQKGPGITIPLVGETGFGIVADGPLKFTLGSQVDSTQSNSSSSRQNQSMSNNANAGGLGFYGFGYASTTNASNAASTALSEATTALNSAVSADSIFFLNPSDSFGESAQQTHNYNTISTKALSYLSGLGVNSNAGQGQVGIDVNDLLEAMAMQRFGTRRSLFGSRYEDLLHYWGLKTQDFRLQHPELVSVARGQLQFSEVLQTAPVDGSGVGNMSGHGIGATRSGRWRYYCHEHGFLITLLIVRPEAVYTQGIERMWTRKTRWDFWNPEMQHIGQQEVLSKEIYADGSEDDELVFGYQNRFDEYRRGKNHVTGEFRTTLDYWNMARQFENRPSLNSEFITANPTDRIFQLSESLSDQLYCMVNNRLIAKRLLSRNGNPM